MTSEDKDYVKGLAGVVVGETAIAYVEGEIGRLSYRGYAVEDLVEHADFYDVALLVLFGEHAGTVEKSALADFLATHQNLTAYEVDILRLLPAQVHPMEMLQGMLPVLERTAKSALAVPEGYEDAIEGLVLAAKIPALIAAYHRIRGKQELIAGRGELDFHSNFLWMFNGKEPEEQATATLNATQILQMEHGFNASTFAGRVTASTLAPVQSVLSAAIGTLYGKLHGGADEAALRMAQEIGSPAKAAAYVDYCLEHKIRIMGVGHREYKTVDPRARVLKPMAERLCRDTEHAQLFATLAAVEEAVQARMAQSGKNIWANVEFYKGAVFAALGIAPEFFTSMFVMARVFGYLAHFLESRQDNRLIRPQALYTGPAPRVFSS